MKNLTTLLLLTTSTYAMDMGQPAGVAAAAIHAGAQAPVAATFIDWMAAGYLPEAPVALAAAGLSGIAAGLAGTLSEIKKSLPASPWEDATIGFNVGPQLADINLGTLAVNIDALDNGGALQPGVHTLSPDDQRALFMKRFNDILHRRNRGEMMTLMTDAVAHIPNIMNDFLNEAIRVNDPSLRNYVLREIIHNLDRMDAPTRLQRYITLGNIFPPLQGAIAYGLAYGLHGIEQNPAELIRRAEAGWVDAQRYVAKGLAYGLHGIEQNPAELRRLAYADGWVGAQEVYAEGLAYGRFGIEQDPAELRRRAEAGWVGAQRFYALGLACGNYGIKQDPAELRRLAYADGWVGAQEVYAIGLARGLYGIEKDHTTLRALAIQHIRNNDSPYVTRYLGTLPTLREMIQFMVGAWNHAEVPAPAVATLPAVVAPDPVPAEVPANVCCSIM